MITMKKQIITLLGVCYVAYALVLSTSAQLDASFLESDYQRQDYLEQEDNGSDGLSPRVHGLEGVSQGAQPEAQPGAQPGAQPEAQPEEGAVVAVATEKEPIVQSFKPNCMIVWTADWCSACEKMRPVAKQLESEGYAVYILNYDYKPELAKRMGVSRLPTTIIHYGGGEVARHVGIVSASTLKKTLKKNKDGGDSHVA